MKNIRIYIADDQFLVLEGLRNLVASCPGMDLCGYCEKREELLSVLPVIQPDVFIVDYTSAACSLTDMAMLKTQLRQTSVLAITPHQKKSVITSALDAGVTSHVLKDCGREEIIEAIETTARAEKFFCGKIVDTLMSNSEEAFTITSSAACEALNISERELEIIRLIAQGYSNKQVAEKLFLSQHTVNTHRKNIMAKLGVNNTAGIVLFAVKESIVSPDQFLFN